MNEIILIAGILLTTWGLTEGLWTTIWWKGIQRRSPQDILQKYGRSSSYCFVPATTGN